MVLGYSLSCSWGADRAGKRGTSSSQPSSASTSKGGSQPRVCCAAARMQVGFSPRSRWSICSSLCSICCQALPSVRAVRATRLGPPVTCTTLRESGTLSSDIPSDSRQSLESRGCMLQAMWSREGDGSSSQCLLQPESGADHASKPMFTSHNCCLCMVYFDSTLNFIRPRRCNPPWTAWNVSPPASDPSESSRSCKHALLSQLNRAARSFYCAEPVGDRRHDRAS